MFVPVWLLLANAVLVIALLRRVFRGPEGDDMIARQRRETVAHMPSPLPSRSSTRPSSTQRSGTQHTSTRPSNTAPQSRTISASAEGDQALLTIPDVLAALAKGRKIEAIKAVRDQTGMGLKEAKQAVERLRAGI